jgi:valyl-tRNA synthetase
MLVGLAALVDEATAAFERYDYARALERTESSFWSFCDDYLELVKNRAYGEGEGARSAQAALGTALDTYLRLFAPFLPFATEEVWSWWRDGSIHRAAWPDAESVRAAGGADGDPAVLTVAAEVLGEVRRAKSEAKRSMRAGVDAVLVRDTAERLAALEQSAEDVKAAGVVEQLATAAGDAFEVEVTLPATDT